MKKILYLAILSVLSTTSVFAETGDELKSWNDSVRKDAVISFVENSINKESDLYIKKENRIAVFDNDGTLWSEKPFYFQLAFALDRIKEDSHLNPEWKTTEPFKSVLNNDLEGIKKSGHEGLFKILYASHTNISLEKYEETVVNWLAATKDPRFGKSYNELTYKPMKEMLNYLQENDYKTYIVSGGGVDFMRAWATEAYKIPSEQIIGSSLNYSYEYKDGQPILIKKAAVNTNNDKIEKVLNIQKIIGKKPVIAVGNSDGDQAMIQWATSQENSLGLIVHHTDAEREWSYDKNSSIGKLDKAMLEANTRSNWHLIDMKTDWSTVY